MFSTIQGGVGMVKRKPSVQALSKPRSSANPLAKFACGRKDSEQSVSESTEIWPLAENSPQDAPFPPGVVVSLEHSMSQKPAARSMLDEVLSFATSAVGYVNTMAKVQNTPLLQDLLSHLCSISGILLQLKILSLNETWADQQSVAMATLCSPSGPLPNLVLKLRELRWRLDRWRCDICQTEGPGPLIRDINLTEVTSCFEPHKKILLFALQNEPRYVGILLNE